jgi:hypothetical protein
VPSNDSGVLVSINRWSLGLAGTLAALIFTVFALQATAQPAIGPAGNVSAFDAKGHRLGQNPRLHRGELVVVVVTGFAAVAAVTVHAPPVLTSQTAYADSKGVVRFRYRVPLSLANMQYLITFSGDPPATPTVLPPSRTGPGDAHVIVVEVPQIGLFRFRLDDPVQSKTSAPGDGNSGAGADALNDSRQNLAFTGVDVIATVALGLLVVLTGVFVWSAGRRRRPKGH